MEILNISVDQPTSSMPTRSIVKKHTTPKVQHMPYTEIAKKMMTEEEVHQKQEGLEENKDSPEQVNEMTEMYAKVFQGIGCHKYRQITLDVDPETKQQIQIQRKIPFAKRTQLDEILQEFEEEDIIEEVQGPTEWISNLVLTPKKDNKLRMNIDMTTANKAIKRTRHIIPTLEELKYNLNGATIFSKLDMKQGYMQFQLHLSSCHMTVFYPHQGLRQMKRVSFRTNSVAELFHKQIKKTLSDIPNCENIYDDILVYGRDQEEHNKTLMRVLQCMEDCGLTLKKEKCEFNKAEIKFFGCIFSKEGMRTDPEKVRAIAEAKEPQTVPEMRSFLGMCNFCAHFIENDAMITAPLREMTKRGAKFEWTEKGIVSFNKLKQALCQETTLGYYDPQATTRIYVDGSKKDGVGCILSQLDKRTREYRPIRYNSRPLKDAETRYSQIEVESLAVYYGITKNYIYLYGMKDFEVVTDNLLLLPLYNKYKQEMPLRQWYNDTVSG